MFPDTSLPGRVHLSMDTPRRDLAGHTLSNPCKKKGASMMVAAGLCIGLDGVGHMFPPYLIPPETKINAARYQDMQLHCVELFEHDEHAKTDPTVDDFSDANEGVTIA